MIVAHVVKRLARGMVLGVVHRWFTTLLALVLVGGAAYVIAGQGLIPGVSVPTLGEASPPVGADIREMMVEEIRPIRGGEQINLILREKSGSRRLVMSVGQSEALAIYADMSAINARAKPKIESPTSYDLMRSLVAELGGTVNRVVVNQVSDETFFAKVIMTTESRQVEVDSRPSDAIALALRARVPIFAELSVLERAGVGGGS